MKSLQCAAQFICAGMVTESENHGQTEFNEHYVANLHGHTTAERRTEILNFLKNCSRSGVRQLYDGMFMVLSQEACTHVGRAW